MNVLYIGGTGRISYSCVLEGVRAGQDITVFNRGTTDVDLPEQVRRIAGDLDDQAAYRKLARGNWDVVCQFKAYDLPRIELDIELFGGGCGQYVFISSASAYRKPPRTWRITEDVPLDNPFWAYSQAKADMEHRLMECHAAGTMPVTIVRPSHTNSRNFPGTFIDGKDIAWRMRNGKAVISHGDGTGLWVLTHADDFAAAFVRLLANPRAIGEAFHITSDEANTWDRILSAMAQALGAEPDLVHVPTDTLIRYNPQWAGPLLGDKAHSAWFDNTKVKAVVGEFTCRIGMAEQLQLAAAAYDEILADFTPDPQLHALLDRIIQEQTNLGA